MSINKAFIPITNLVVEKAIKRAKNVNPDGARNIVSLIDNVILEDEDINQKIDALVEELREPPPESGLAVTFRAILRPTITLGLTITFILLILGQVGLIGTVPDDPNVAKPFFERWDKAFTIFLAIYGPIIGFWFGERTMKKKR